MRFSAVLTLVAGLCAATHATAADRTMIVLDASGSMWGQIGGRSKIEIARETLGTVLQSVPAGSELGLMVYGHREKGSCSDIQLAVPPGVGTAGAIADFVNGINPKGKTPLSDSVQQAADILKYTEEKATVVLVTDGLETCEADPCVLASALESQGVDFTAHVVGFGLTEEEGRQVACLAENTGGKYFQASDAGQLVAALTATVAAPMVRPEPVEEVPEPEPEAKFNVEFDSVLFEGGPSLEGNTSVAWRILRADPNNQPVGDYLDIQYKGAYPANYPPGKYVAVAKLDNSIERQVPFEIKQGEIAKPFVNFDAGLIILHPKRTPEDQEDDRNARIDVRFGGYSTTHYGTSKFYASAGEVHLTGRIDPTVVEETVLLKAGETIERDIIIGSGIVMAKATYAEGGPQVESGDVFFEVVSANKNIDGSRKSFGFEYGTDKRINTPAGDLVLTARLGSARGEVAFSVKAGELAEAVVNINAGVVAITAPGAHRIDILEAKKDIQGNQKEVSMNYGGQHQDTLHPGDYIIRAQYEGDKAPVEKQATVAAGERTEVTVE